MRSQYLRSGYELFTDVSVRAPLSQLKQRWDRNPKYFKNIPKHAYRLNWSPVIARTGQDIEVDPYDRISKKGNYKEMIQNWQGWYRLDNLLSSRDAPQSALDISRDLSQVGVQLNDYHSSVLMWKAVSEIESGIKLGIEEKTRAAIEAAGNLHTEICDFHTAGLYTGAALSALYGLTEQPDELSSLEISNRHLLHDPEESLESKQSFYENLSLAGVLMKNDDIMMKWQAEMRKQKIAPSLNYWTVLLHHLRDQEKPMLMLEAKKNMELTCEKDNSIYYLLSSIASLCAAPEIATNLQLEMKSESLRNPNKLQYSAKFMHEGLLKAYLAKRDMVAALSTWERLKHVNTKILYRRTGKHESRNAYTPTTQISASMIKGFDNASDAYKWWRKEALGIKGLLPLRGFNSVVLQELASSLVGQQEWDLLSDLHDELVKKQQQLKKDKEMHLNPTHKLPDIRITNGMFWKDISVGLAHAGRLKDAHTTLIKKIDWSRHHFNATYASHLFTCTSTQKDDNSDLVLAATVEYFQRNKYWKLDGDSYMYIITHQLAVDPSIIAAMRVFREASNASLLPTDKGMSFLLTWTSKLSLSDSKRNLITTNLLPLLWSYYFKASVERYGKISYLVGRLFNKCEPTLPRLGEALLASMPGWDNQQFNSLFGSEVSEYKSVLVLDGTTAFNIEDYIEKGVTCILPQSVLMQLYDHIISPNSTATDKEKEFFSDSIFRFQQALFSKDIILLPHIEECNLLAGNNYQSGTPQRIADLTIALSSHTETQIVTNDVQMAKFCSHKEISCLTPNKHSKRVLEGISKSTRKQLPPSFDNV